ncbi:aldo/keto reductase [Actinoplanes sp. NEAU-A12]|uniref:Aldo/keto reductase n=1 Tax=Actinoplanes sandaracinus TaxID=3045177 RepID=A0ABT6WZL3_9ACTN|nr:aldo/keto reductase [Actinoplanes sandaracinus]MDI6105157.1 aldo/keto reductase [Actinoplanes sandaracinus]
MRDTRLTDTLSVSAIGLGCSPMSHGYNPAERDDKESIRVIHRAVELGINLFDTADVYGPFSNEELLGRALREHRDEVHVATKCGLVAGPGGKFQRNGRPEYLRAACEGSLRRLQVDTLGLYQLHRVDPAVPLEDTWGALGELVTEGKVRNLGISHATCEELEFVHSIFPIAAVQYELSVWSTHNRDDILPWCRKNGVGFLAFAPIGRGFLTGTVGSTPGIEDSRSRDPRFSAEALRANQAILDGLRTVAARHGATPAQVSIAWTLTQGDNVVPIPGTRRRRWLEENAAAVQLRLEAQDLRDIDNLPAATGEMSWDSTRVVGARPAE